MSVPGDTPDSVEARRAANERVIRGAIDAYLKAHDPIPLPGPGGFTMPNIAAAPSNSKDSTRMSDNGVGNGLVATNQRMDRLEHSVELMTGEISKVVGLVQKVSEKVDVRFDESNRRAEEKAVALVNAAKPDTSKYSTPITIIASAFFLITSGFFSYVQFGVNNDFTRLEKNIDKLMEAQSKRADRVDEKFAKFVDDTVPRNELTGELRQLDERLKAKVGNEIFNKTAEFRNDQFKQLREAVDDLRDNTLKRPDLDGRFSDFGKRVDLISGRVEQLQQSSAGTAVLQEQVKEVQSQVAELRRSLLAAPKYLVHPGESQ